MSLIFNKATGLVKQEKELLLFHKLNKQLVKDIFIINSLLYNKSKIIYLYYV